ncbi:MAG TPA: DUF5317 domain-containing protein [Candidatus Deferrimicrobium sp.]|nr:DUF5317 domain-containing protein [Candidatus Deferrimicrobium sp.]
MLIETLVLALIIAYVQGGRLTNLKDIPFNWMGLALLAFGLQFLINLNSSFLLNPYFSKQVLHNVSYLFLFLFLLRNYSLPGLKCICVGVLLNFLVITLNGGAMPVDPSMLPEQHRQLLALGQGGTHGLLTAQTHLALLADRIYIYLPLLRGQLFSIGDIFIDVGSFYLIYFNMKLSKNYRVRTVYMR